MRSCKNKKRENSVTKLENKISAKKKNKRRYGTPRWMATTRCGSVGVYWVFFSIVVPGFLTGFARTFTVLFFFTAAGRQRQGPAMIATSSSSCRSFSPFNHWRAATSYRVVTEFSVGFFFSSSNPPPKTKTKQPRTRSSKPAQWKAVEGRHKSKSRLA